MRKSFHGTRNDVFGRHANRGVLAGDDCRFTSGHRERWPMRSVGYADLADELPEWSDGLHGR